MTDSNRPQLRMGTAGSRRISSNRRRFLKATAGVGAGVSLTGCLGQYQVLGGNSDEETVKIGVLAPNPNSNRMGRSMVQAAELAVTHLNEEGGILGREVELVVGNTKESPLEARRQYQRLILEEGVDATTGVFSSEALLSIIDDVAEQETLHLTSAAATSEVSRMVRDDYERYKYHFRIGPNNDIDLGRIQMDFLTEMYEDLGWNSIALLAEDYDWTEKPWEVYQDRLADTDIDVVYEERYPAASNDFTEQYNQAEEADADAVFITTAHTGTPALMDWKLPAKRSFGFGGVHVPMQLPAYYDLVGGQCRYAVTQTSSTAKTSITENTQEFVTAYQDEYGGQNPIYTGYHTYDGVRAIAYAAEESNSLDSDDMVGALENASHPGYAATVEFYDNDSETPHDLVYNYGETVYFQWQENEDGEGVQEAIWPPDKKTGDYVTPPWLETEA
ncbi:ABC transporter substrate-binding protein [Haloterrigena sp. SYSU A558-1]|uniref:ABC transporter substrate-binding protein n=1 Tax=Haloterrigena gelatinilytica TaxID=2741724 RepID=A0A8J8KE36_9EURY|nr:ABC transporter substrate-binding protein [Haloterrigena gelatinilytica]NUB89607.1 ABC transporter substrate-binding protein [Haloterrigena gelatinilytica]NUC74563.1 ABC transporter substrate-binding protein [Haloterrigena gelatinilytica]